MRSRLSNFNWTSLLLGIIAMIAAMAAFRDPAANLLALTVFFGVTALARGIIQIYAKFALKDTPGVNANVFLLLGIVNILFAIVLLANLWTGMVVLPTLFAVWFIAESLLGLMNAGAARLVGNGYYWFRIVLGILGILVGASLLFNPVSATLTMAFMVGFYFMMISVNCFVEAFNTTPQDSREWDSVLNTAAPL